LKKFIIALIAGVVLFLGFGKFGVGQASRDEAITWGKSNVVTNTRPQSIRSDESNYYDEAGNPVSGSLVTDYIVTYTPTGRTSEWHDDKTAGNPQMGWCWELKVTSESLGGNAGPGNFLTSECHELSKNKLTGSIVDQGPMSGPDYKTLNWTN
jgi:hypothetical protein